MMLKSTTEESINMRISEFTMPELNYLRDNCNFVDLEKPVFEMRSAGIPLEIIAEDLNLTIDGIKKISRKINKKISRVI